MSVWPRRLYPRLVLLLAAVSALVVIAALAMLRLTASQITAYHAARGLASQVAAADALLTSVEGRERLRQLGLRLAEDAPPPGRPLPIILRDIQGYLQEFLPQRTLRLSSTPQPMLWVSRSVPARGWIGVPMLPLRSSLLWAAAGALVLSLVLIVAAAAWYARSLTAPLGRLAAAAPEIAAGAEPPPLPAGAAQELRELDAALAHAAADVRSAARERELMLAALSHDMRTPLARLRLQLELAAGLGDGERQGLEQDIEEIDALIGQFIGYVRDGRDEATQALDLAGLLRDLADAQARAGIDWQLDVPPHCPIPAKPLALRRALGNLMDNARRHGAAPFRATLRTSAREACVTVADAGGGVPAEFLPRLGEPFRRGDAARTGSGSGLGLASARRIAAQHGGRLDFANAEGGGFVAALTLPRAGAA